jgi:hypothetical protein
VIRTPARVNVKAPLESPDSSGASTFARRKRQRRRVLDPHPDVMNEHECDPAIQTACPHTSMSWQCDGLVLKQIPFASAYKSCCHPHEFSYFSVWCARSYMWIRIPRGHVKSSRLRAVGGRDHGVAGCGDKCHLWQGNELYRAPAS